uniref:Uncharacterized protein n=1 Tax=Amphimedon queenslandica TaxID=400682 RepID=A0A1X7UE79_AMPQE
SLILTLVCTILSLFFLNWFQTYPLVNNIGVGRLHHHPDKLAVIVRESGFGRAQLSGVSGRTVTLSVTRGIYFIGSREELYSTVYVQINRSTF